MDVKFWGVRGSVAVSGAQVAVTGGNTSCVEVTSQGHRLILDAGTGIRSLGEAMMKEGPPTHATLLFSHLHWDHVQGFPFFTPAFIPGNQLSLFGPGATGAVELEKVLRKQMQPPSFPVALEAMRSTMRFDSALPGVTQDVGPLRIAHGQAEQSVEHRLLWSDLLRQRRARVDLQRRIHASPTCNLTPPAINYEPEALMAPLRTLD